MKIGTEVIDGKPCNEEQQAKERPAPSPKPTTRGKERRKSSTGNKAGKKEAQEAAPKKKIPAKVEWGSALVPRHERAALQIAAFANDFIKTKGGQYLRDENGKLHIIIGGKRVSLNYDRENDGLGSLLFASCGISSLSREAQSAIQLIRIEAAKRAGELKLRRFSAVSNGKLYVPIGGNRLLLVTKLGLSVVPNGTDDLWVEHPYGDPFLYAEGDPKPGLALFERLLVETQACVAPEMKWLVAIQAGLFPFIRDEFSARFLLQFRGPSQDGGKTTGGRRFVCLHGLGEIKGDVSVAMVSNEGDIGLVVLDNKEQANYEQPLVDYCVFAATGGQYGRSNPDGSTRSSKGRPVVVITTIEGMPKKELHTRTVNVEYRVVGKKLDRDVIEAEILRERSRIESALMRVLSRFLEIRSQRDTPDAVPDFRENFRADADLLRAYADVAGKPEAWAEQIIVKWAAVIGGQEPEENELEHPILRVLAKHALSLGEITMEQTTFKGRKGKLYVTTCNPLLTALENLNLRDGILPRTPNALSRRLHDGKFVGFEVVDEESAPELSALTRTARRKPIGFFMPDDGNDDQ